MFYKFFAQKEEICNKCNCELPTGSIAYSYEDNDIVICEDCLPDNLDNNN